MSIDSTRPVIERIANTIYTRLSTMTAGTFPNSPVSEVIRPVRTESFSPKNYQIILILGDQEQVEALSKNGNPPSVAFTADFHICCHVMPSEKDATPFDEYCSTFYADVVECLTDSVDANWWRWGNLAVDSNIGPMQPMDTDGGLDGFIVPLTITYRVSEWSPYEPRY